MTFDPAAFVDEFRVEAADHLRLLGAELLSLERQPSDAEPIRRMFLSAHTIKSAAAMLGLASVRELSHAMEDVLAHLRDTRVPLDRVTADLLFRSLDALQDMVERATPGDVRAGAASAELVDALRQRATGRPTPPPPVARPSPRALLVEDSPTVRLLATMVLSDAGFQVDAVADGQQALAQAQAQPYELVVASTQNHGLRGLDLAAALRASPAGRNLPIILMSSDDNPEHRRRAAEIGIQAYIRKGSSDRERLAETARQLLAGAAVPGPQESAPAGGP